MWGNKREAAPHHRNKPRFLNIYNYLFKQKLEATCKAKAGSERCTSTALKNFWVEWITQVKEKGNYGKALNNSQLPALCERLLQEKCAHADTERLYFEEVL